MTRLSQADRYKNIPTLINAFTGVVRARPDARLLIVGDGDDRPHLEALAAKQLPPGCYRFAGLLSDAAIQSAWEESSIFALPSDGEGFGLVFAEAMSHGLPCLCGNRDAAREVVQSDETGWSLDAQNPAAWTASILQLLAQPDLADSMGTAGQRRYAQLFTAEAFRGRIRSALAQNGFAGTS